MNGSPPDGRLLLLALAAAFCCGASILLKATRRTRRARIDPDAAVTARAVMSDNELDFFRTLRAALPDLVVLAQVSFGALIEPRGLKPGTPAFWAVRNRFGQKVADYVVLDAAGRLVAVIELDDRTHDKANDAKRDALLASAGIAVVRYESRAKPQASTIRRDLRLAAAPASGSHLGLTPTFPEGTPVFPTPPGGRRPPAAGGRRRDDGRKARAAGARGREGTGLPLLTEERG